ncbi:hypothetical protein VPH35_095402 [Triticum aestivum]
MTGSHCERSTPTTLGSQIRFLWSSCPTMELALPFLKTRMMGLSELSSSAAMGLVEKELVSAGIRMHLGQRSRLTELIWRHIDGRKGWSCQEDEFGDRASCK